jgi:hypothetical protein
MSRLAPSSGENLTFSTRSGVSISTPFRTFGPADKIEPSGTPDRNSRRYQSNRKKVTLCPACPEVEITDRGVTIGGVGNTVRLSHDEWNELVRLVRSGELREVQGIGTA